MISVCVYVVIVAGCALVVNRVTHLDCYPLSLASVRQYITDEDALHSERRPCHLLQGNNISVSAPIECVTVHVVVDVRGLQGGYEVSQGIRTVDREFCVVVFDVGLHNGCVCMCVVG